MNNKKNKACVQFGNNLRHLRQSKSLSQESFADLLQMHRTYVGGLERGERNPTLTVIVKIAKALHFPVQKLLENVGN
ncbi:MAG TPA: helix-turn-helix transcriptional regulator [Chitinophagales bacterium]|nr:helix-turn-helix transcriptional regulator [Chitinophagales bacterium]HMW93489.1 helix-turn-helix transcriptional regulator [Chitinophagales bacterium]HMZ92888.1 helix-turn-helix transcriptional regulator [Chitinophagales bacterium]HNG25923.1 helix-turn-helix transcriptional regulator [Chitinophagales bacterium]